MEISISKWWFQFIVSSLVWLILWLPFMLPDKITLQSAGGPLIWTSKVWDIWAAIGCMIAIYMSYMGIWYYAGVLFEHIGRQIMKKQDKITGIQ